MTKTLTEQWKDGELDGGYYYYKTESDKIVLGFQYPLLQYPYDCHHNTIDDVKEVLAPVPTYEEYQKLINYSDDLDKTTDVLKDAQDKWLEKIKENKKLKQQLADAEEVIKGFWWADTNGSIDKYKMKWGDK